MDCWAFSATNTVANLYAKLTGLWLQFSPQFLVDCMPFNYPPYFAMHGVFSSQSLWPAAQFIINMGLPIEQAYPYVGTQQACK